uniref:Uncharacterized protein n=1 Tax=Pseudictyota dubia TaxID=2749911 RepID=A0A7R9ZIZ1_9STRA
MAAHAPPQDLPTSAETLIGDDAILLVPAKKRPKNKRPGEGFEEYSLVQLREIRWDCNKDLLRWFPFRDRGGEKHLPNGLLDEIAATTSFYRRAQLVREWRLMPKGHQKQRIADYKVAATETRKRVKSLARRERRSLTREIRNEKMERRDAALREKEQQKVAAIAQREEEASLRQQEKAELRERSLEVKRIQKMRRGSLPIDVANSISRSATLTDGVEPGLVDENESAIVVGSNLLLPLCFSVESIQLSSQNDGNQNSDSVVDVGANVVPRVGISANDELSQWAGMLDSTERRHAFSLSMACYKETLPVARRKSGDPVADRAHMIDRMARSSFESLLKAFYRVANACVSITETMGKLEEAVITYGRHSILPVDNPSGWTVGCRISASFRPLVMLMNINQYNPPPAFGRHREEEDRRHKTQISIISGSDDLEGHALQVARESFTANDDTSRFFALEGDLKTSCQCHVPDEIPDLPSLLKSLVTLTPSESIDNFVLSPLRERDVLRLEKKILRLYKSAIEGMSLFSKRFAHLMKMFRQHASSIDIPEKCGKGQPTKSWPSRIPVLITSSLVMQDGKLERKPIVISPRSQTFPIAQEHFLQSIFGHSICHHRYEIIRCQSETTAQDLVHEGKSLRDRPKRQNRKPIECVANMRKNSFGKVVFGKSGKVL